MLPLSTIASKLREILFRVDKLTEPGSFAVIHIEAESSTGQTHKLDGVISDIAVIGELPGAIALQLKLQSTTDSPTTVEIQPCAETWPTLTQIETDYIGRVLRHTHGNKQAAARILGIDRTTVIRKITQYQIDVPAVVKRHSGTH
jgi:DNA-binding NtrC family response regulator